MNSKKPGDHPNFRKNALGVKRPFSELWESSGVFSEHLGSEFRNSILGIRNSILGMASHDLSRHTKNKILGATPGAIAGIDGNPHERFSFASPCSERFFKNWGGPRAQDEHKETPCLVRTACFYVGTVFFEKALHGPSLNGLRKTERVSNAA